MNIAEQIDEQYKILLRKRITHLKMDRKRKNYVSAKL